MQLTNEQFLQLLGAKEVQIYSLQLKLAAAQAEIAKLKEGKNNDSELAD